jgi:hypothetical protein
MLIIYTPGGTEEHLRSGLGLIFKIFSMSSANFSAVLVEIEYVSSHTVARASIRLKILLNVLYRFNSWTLGSSCMLRLLVTCTTFTSMVYLFSIYSSGTDLILLMSSIFSEWQQRIPANSNFLQLHVTLDSEGENLTVCSWCFP